MTSPVFLEKTPMIFSTVTFFIVEDPLKIEKLSSRRVDIIGMPDLIP